LAFSFSFGLANWLSESLKSKSEVTHCVLCVPTSVKTLAAHRRARLNEAQTLHQFFRDIDDEEAWIKYVIF